MISSPMPDLFKKLGFMPGETIYMEDTPGWYSDFAEANGLEISADLPAVHAHLFFTDIHDLQVFLKESDLNDIANSLWVSWPKKDGTLKSNISDTDIRSALLNLGLVDVKVAAIDTDWSGLKFLRRKN
jgi:hypothetical protein